MRLMDREGGVPVAIMDAPYALLGVTALEALGLKVNAAKQTLEEDWPWVAPPMFGVSQGAPRA